MGAGLTKGWMIGLGAFFVMLLVGSLVLALTEREAILDEGTPEWTVQRLLQAVKSEDYKTAHALLSVELSAECEAQDYLKYNIDADREIGDGRVTLSKTTVIDDTAVVETRVTRIYGTSPFGTSESTMRITYSLGLENGEWRFTDYPWPFRRCGELGNIRSQPPSPIKPVPVPAP